MGHLRFLFSLSLLAILIACNDIRIETTAPLKASQLLVSAPSSVVTNQCTSWVVSTNNANDQRRAVTSDSQISLSLEANGVSVPALYSDSLCTLPITQATIPAGSSSITVYTRYNLLKTLTLKATHTDLTSDDDSVVVSTWFTQTQLLAGARDKEGNVEGIGGAARLAWPGGLVTDGNYLYMSLFQKHAIVRIDLLTHEMTHFAGLYNNRDHADGIGALAFFSNPHGMTILNGFLYVADRGNNVIRKIDLITQQVTTLCGSPNVPGSADGVGSAALFSTPAGMTNDGTHLYVTDPSTSTIRKIDPITGAVTTLAGDNGVNGTNDGVGPLARFTNPYHLTTDGTNLYVPDTGAHTIRKVVIATGAVTTIAGMASTPGFVDGTGTAAQFSSPEALVYDNLNLYIADRFNNSIRKMDLVSGAVTTVVGAPGSPDTYAEGPFASARFKGPSHLVLINDLLYTAELENFAIRQIDLTLQTTSLVAGYAANRPQRTFDGIGTNARFTEAHKFAVDSTHIYIPDCGSTIRRLNLATGAVDTIAGLDGNFNTVDGVGSAARFQCPMAAALSGNYLYTSEYATIRRIDLTTMQVTTVAGTANFAGIADGTGSAARFFYPDGLTINGNDLYIFDSSAGTIQKMDLTTFAVVTIAGSFGVYGGTDGVGTAARFWGPSSGVYLNNQLFVTDLYGSTIRKVDLATMAVTTFAGSDSQYDFADGVGSAARFMEPTAITTDGDYLYVTDPASNTIRRIDPVTAEVTTLLGQGPHLAGDRDVSGGLSGGTVSQPFGIFSTPQGIYFSNRGLNISIIR